MTGGVVDAVAAAIREHRVQYLDQWICGRCQRTFADIKEADAHVAAAVVEALGFQPEWTVESKWGVDEHNVSDFYATPAEIADWRNRQGIPTEVVQRFVSPWVSVVRGVSQAAEPS